MRVFNGWTEAQPIGLLQRSLASTSVKTPLEVSTLRRRMQFLDRSSLLRTARRSLAAGLIHLDGSSSPITNSFHITHSMMARHDRLLTDFHLLFRALGFATNI